MTRTKILPLYVAAQLFIVLILVVSFLNIRNKDESFVQNPEIVGLCEEQTMRADHISESILRIVVYKGSRKDNEVAEMVSKMSVWQEEQKKLAEYIKNSDLEEDKKELVVDAFRNSNKHMNKMSISSQVIIQKSDISTLSNHFHNLIIKNENAYNDAVKIIIKIYKNNDTELLASHRTKEQMVFSFSILLVILNVVILATPARKFIFN